MRSYKEMVDAGDWPPTNRESIMFVLGALFGAGVISAIFFLVGK